ncbi:uncharacterized mitochondrial protein AtMg00820-like [Telopea speciosissima]|uniref:uncharacterized mitochondrial protein AtMg00820-like n=1 Tax=Telopea speciosissima TaxID=54955 RepID=UPI001CC630BD|nr:uncharacterized mitochondrial protein AtMg00820-like [Telopea speciosissima]
MVTCLRDGVTKPIAKLNLLTMRHPIAQALVTSVTCSDEEPMSYTVANKNPKWRKAMSEEFDALLRNGTWELVPPHPSFNVVGNKWVYQIKRHADGTISRYKARLVAKGFTQ